jgi:hypothetical protein
VFVGQVGEQIVEVRSHQPILAGKSSRAGFPPLDQFLSRL